MQTSEQSFLGIGTNLHSAQRYVRCEATRECSMFLKPFRGGEGTNGRASGLVDARRDSSGGRFQMFAITRLGVTMRKICDDYDRGNKPPYPESSHFSRNGF